MKSEVGERQKDSKHTQAPDKFVVSTRSTYQEDIPGMSSLSCETKTSSMSSGSHKQNTLYSSLNTASYMYSEKEYGLLHHSPKIRTQT